MMIGCRGFARSVIFALCLAVMLCVGGGRVDAESFAQLAARTVSAMGEEATRTVLAPEISDSERRARMTILLAQHFDMAAAARQSLGYHWATATPAQQREFIDLFTVLLVDTYASMLRFHEPLTFTVIGQHDEGPRDALVTSQLGQRSDGGFQRIDWRLKLGEDGQPRVIDVIVTGVSMVRSEQDEFDASIRTVGQGMEGLLKQLRAKYAVPVAALN
jgi:phospholipid transport system substrate-binding protein